MTDLVTTNTSPAAATARNARDAPPASPRGASTNGGDGEATGRRQISLLDLSDKFLLRIFAQGLALEDRHVCTDDSFDYFDIIGEVPFLERLHSEFYCEIIVRERRSKFPSLRSLDVSGRSTAQSILHVCGADLVE
ncbi:hypothetical protein JCM10295v2_005331 [Rhodotorula toruloides]